MKRKMTGRKLDTLAAAMGAVGHLTGIKFCYGLMKNDAVGDEAEKMAAGLKHSKRFQEYNKKRIELCKEHATKDENGQPITVRTPGGGPRAMEYAGITDNVAFQTAWVTLKDEYKDALDERDELLEEYDDALDAEVEIDFYMIKFSDVPETITAKQLMGISDLIEDDTDGAGKPAEESAKPQTGEESPNKEG